MATAFHARLYGRFIKINSNLRGKELYRMNKGSNFIDSFGSRGNVKVSTQYKGSQKLKNKPLPATVYTIL